MEKKQSSYQQLKKQFEIQSKELDEVKNSSKKEKKGSHVKISDTIPYVQTLYRIRTDIATFRNALLRAENIYNPNRIELYRMFKDMMLDAHLSAVIQNRKASILSSEFIITKNGNKVNIKSDIFKTKWFYDFCNLALDSMYYGYSLIEFGDLSPDKEFDEVSIVPREYVKPEFGIVGHTSADIVGDSFLEGKYSEWCLGVGMKTDLGLLTKAAPYVIWKKGAIMAYAEYTEMMGVPIRILKTDVYDEETRAAGENFMRNLGSSAYAVIGKDDVVEFAQSKDSTGAEKLFNGLIDKSNEEISKLILGGTGMMTANAYVGSAEIHQENFLMICGQDKLFIENVLNYQLVPFLIKRGFDLKGCRIEIQPDEELSLKERFAIDSALLPYYKIPASYFKEKYGTEVEDIEINPNEISQPYESGEIDSSISESIKPEEKQVDKFKNMAVHMPKKRQINGNIK